MMLLRSSTAAAMLMLGFACAAGAQDAEFGNVVHANAALPRHPPIASLASWTPAMGRARWTFAVHDAVLRGYRYAPPHASRVTILFFNGSGNTVLAEDPRYRALAAQGATVDVVDYRGGGFSTGTADMDAFAHDGLAMYDERASHGPVIVYGYSLGTAIATQIAAQRDVAALVLAAPIASAAEELGDYLAERHMPANAIDGLMIAPDAHAAFDEAAHVARVTAPLLIVHGTADTNVPIAQGREVFAAAGSSKKRFVELPGIGHGGIVDAGASLAALRELIIDVQR